MKRVFFGLLRAGYVVAIGILVAYSVFSQPVVAANVTSWVLTRFLPREVGVEGLAFRGVVIAPSAVLLDNVIFTVRYAGVPYQIEADRVAVVRTGLFLSPRTGILIVSGLTVKGAGMVSSGGEGHIRIRLTKDGPYADGSIAVRRAVFQEYEATDIRMMIKASAQQLMITRGVARAYGGTISANITYAFPPDGKVRTTATFGQIDTARIPFLREKFKGVVTGQVSFAGTARQMDMLTADLSSSESDMETTLFRSLMGDVNNSLSFLPFAAILNTSAFIHLDKVTGSVHNEGADSVAIELHLVSTELNVNLNPSVTINVR